ncbi:Indoleamine 2,3-dioxygenase [Pisolithus marmoratus]|nr:Indoleamine 2,3-dioxygenase [Pisolithus marmoratus]
MSTLGWASYPPICRLPEQWKPRETILDNAMHERLQLVIKQDITDEEMKMLDSWQLEVRELPILPIQDLTSESLLHRAHHVLAFIMHFHIHTLPLTAPVVILASIAIPLLKVSSHLQLLPITTYSDVLLYIWELKGAPLTSEMENKPEWAPDLRNLKSQDLFTWACVMKKNSFCHRLVSNCEASRRSS